MCVAGEEREDRRIRRSRKLLKQGLLELMQRKRFSEISVRDITDRVDLNRGTFYLHYPDTTALLENLEDDLENELQRLVDAHLQESAQTNTLRPVLEPILEYLVANRETCETLAANQESGRFFDRLQSLCYRNGHELIRMWCADLDDDRMSYLLGYVTFGLIGLIRIWFGRGLDLPQQELLETADRLLAGTIRGVTGRGTDAWT